MAGVITGQANLTELVGLATAGANNIRTHSTSHHLKSGKALYCTRLSVRGWAYRLDCSESH